MKIITLNYHESFWPVCIHPFHNAFYLCKFFIQSKYNSCFRKYLLSLDLDLGICATKAIKTSCNASCASLWEHSYSYLLHFFSSSRPAIPSLVPHPGKLLQRLSRFAARLPLLKVPFLPAKTITCLFRAALRGLMIWHMMIEIHFGIGLPVPLPARSDFLFARMP